jgi:hypothetical protein
VARSVDPADLGGFRSVPEGSARCIRLHRKRDVRSSGWRTTPQLQVRLQ